MSGTILPYRKAFISILHNMICYFLIDIATATFKIGSHIRKNHAAIVYSILNFSYYLFKRVQIGEKNGYICKRIGSLGEEK